MEISYQAIESNYQALFDQLLGFQATWIANIGVKKGLFSAIRSVGDAGIKSKKLAEMLSYDPRYVGVWCRGAYAFNLLQWENGKGYSLSPEMVVILFDETHPLYISSRLQVSTAFYEDFLAFPKLMETGGTWPRNEHDPFLLESIHASTKRDCAMITDQVMIQIPEIMSALDNGGSLLEIGAGGGQHTIHYALHFPNAKISAIEYDETSVRLAQKRIDEANLAVNVDLHQGDANQLSFDNQFDVVTMNLVLHETGGPDEYRNVLRRVYRALKPGGHLIVSELPYPDHLEEYQSNPIYQRLAGLQFHETIVGCGMITTGELRKYFGEAHFINVQAIDQPNPGRFVMVGEKAENLPTIF